MCVILGLNSYCQDDNISGNEKIDFNEEIDEISDFLKTFWSISDPIELKDYIIFPDFRASHRCFGTYDLGYVKFDSTKVYRTEIEIKEALDKEGCINPLHFCQIMIGENKELRDSLNQEGFSMMEFYYCKDENQIKRDSLFQYKLSIEEYCFSKKANQMKYLKWFFNEYDLPIDTGNLNFNNINKFDMEFWTKRKNSNNLKVLSLIITQYGFCDIEIYKLDGKYKVKGIYRSSD